MTTLTTTTTKTFSKEEQDFLFYSNLGYLLPIGTSIYLLIEFSDNKPSIEHKMSWWYLFFLMILTTVTMVNSMFYHNCKKHIDFQKEFEGDNKSRICPIGKGMQFTQVYFTDILFSNLSLLGTFLFLLPISITKRIYWFMISILYNIMVLSFRDLLTTPTTTQSVAALPGLLAGLIYFYMSGRYFFGGKTLFTYKTTYELNSVTNYPFVFLIMAIISAIVGFFIFMADETVIPYYIGHSIWHILGGLSGCFFLLSYIPKFN